MIGTTCVGKSTFLREIPEGIEIAKLAPPLTNEEKEFYYHAPLTKENNKMIAMVAKKAFVKAGQPVFDPAIANGTELVVYLTIDDELLKKRVANRKVNFAYAKVMQGFINIYITPRFISGFLLCGGRKDENFLVLHYTHDREHNVREEK